MSKLPPSSTKAGYLTVRGSSKKAPNPATKPSTAAFEAGKDVFIQQNKAQNTRRQRMA